MIRTLLILVSIMTFTGLQAQNRPKVFIMTDINLIGGDPDDRQSFLHLLWYSDQLDIVGIVPDYWKGQSIEACMDGLVAYRSDYEEFGFEQKGMIAPNRVVELISRSEEEAIANLKKVTDRSTEPIYVLVWGHMLTLRSVLNKHPEMVSQVRVLSIGTGVKYGPKDEVPGEDCTVINWNGKGRNDIFNDSRFKEMWWLESNWTYNGMFEGKEPAKMFIELQNYGAMGKHIKTVTRRHEWAQYFRVGDTPTVTYLIDDTHDPNDPTESSWAGKFKKPFPDTRPNYYTDDNGTVDWDYADPCNTWHNKIEMYQYNKSTLVAERQEMYDRLIQKLNHLYQ